jgi:hypothetical protein
LSEVSSCQLWIPGLDRAVQLTRSELEKLIAPDIEATVDTLETALKDASVSPGDLAGVYLVGGSSRIPLVADTIWRRLGVKPAVQDNPKSVVALGAADYAPQRAPAPPRFTARAGADTGAAAQPPAAAAVLGGGEIGTSRFCSYVAADVGLGAWAAGTEARAQLVLDRPGPEPATVRARDEPAAGRDTEQLAREVGAFRAARTNGYEEIAVSPSRVAGTGAGLERRFWTTTNVGRLVMVERYLVHHERALVIATQEHAVAMIDAAALGPEPPPGLFANRLELPYEGVWTPVDQVVIRRRGTPYSVLVEHTRGDTSIDVSAWLQRKIDELLPRLPGALVVGRAASSVIEGIAGEIATLRWQQRGSPMLTKLGVATLGCDVFSVTISLSHNEQNQFASLARQARLNPRVLPNG